MLKPGDKVKLSKFGKRALFSKDPIIELDDFNRVYTIVSIERGFHLDDSPNADIVKTNCEVLNNFLITSLHFDKV